MVIGTAFIVDNSAVGCLSADIIRVSHAIIVSRELGVPAIVGTQTATRTLQDGQPITLSCAEGDRGAVYEGTLEFETIEFDLADLPETETDVMLNIASPAAAMRWWRLPARGVGLARMEFVINHLVKVHPMALVAPEKVTSEDARRVVLDTVKNLIIVYIKCSIETCAERDPKGLYTQAKNGEIDTLIGVNSDYLPPDNPDLVIDTEDLSPVEAVEAIIKHFDQAE